MSCPACEPGAFYPRCGSGGSPGRAWIVRVDLDISTEHSEPDRQTVFLDSETSPVLEACIRPRGTVLAYQFSAWSVLCSCDEGQAIRRREDDRAVNPSKQEPAIPIEKTYLEVIGTDPPPDSAARCVALRDALRKQAAVAWPEFGSRVERERDGSIRGLKCKMSNQKPQTERQQEGEAW